MDIGEAVLALLTTGGVGSAIVTTFRSRALLAVERERAARIAAETKAAQDGAVIQAYNHARADLEEAKGLYDTSSKRERACREEMVELRAEMESELERQDARCTARLSAMSDEMAELRRAIQAGA